ncbi:MAG: class I SAM-dependent rRNA methyltransferase, partial [Planctomycetia bacterium]|nr:class I SAM-dependent rRNA methyltransferase [Planctomycetia bacterium]
MMSQLARVVLKPRRARPFFARHPWVFVTSIGRVEGDPAPGDEVDVFSHEDRFVARGIFNPHSAIRVRLYRWDGGPLDDDFWA